MYGFDLRILGGFHLLEIFATPVLALFLRLHIVWCGVRRAV